MSNSKILTVIAIAALASGLGANASAETVWQKNHPARAEINHRLAHQDQRIKKEVREGEITHAQAAALHRKDRHIRREERSLASQRGGHLTGQEAHALNHQENAVSAQIGR